MEVLANSGYNNYYYGKWHAGSGTALDYQCEGFSYPGYNNPYTKPKYKKYLEEFDLPEFEAKVTHQFMDPNWKKTKELGIEIGTVHHIKEEWAIEHAAGLMTTPKETHEAFFLAYLACEQLKKIATSDKEKPFHLRVDFWGPHQPYYVPEEFLELYNPKSIPEHPNFNIDLSSKPEVYKHEINYPISDKGKLIQPNPLPWSVWQEVLAHNYAHISLIDEAGGLILNTLEDLDLVNNTFIIWTTDHGDGISCHGGHFNKDAYMPEELVRIPMAVRFDGMIKPKQICNKLVSNLDIPSTFLELAQADINHEIHGKSLLPLCMNNANDWREDLLIETHGTFHLHVGRMVVENQYKYIWNDNDMDELYDLDQDPYELNNLINNEQYIEVLNDMINRLKKWRAITGDTITKKELKRKKRKN